MVFLRMTPKVVFWFPQAHTSTHTHTFTHTAGCAGDDSAQEVTQEDY